MKLENRYLVLKQSDLEKVLTSKQKNQLNKIASNVSSWRKKNNKPILDCLIIESDWPEHEWALHLLSKRVDNTKKNCPRCKSEFTTTESCREMQISRITCDDCEFTISAEVPEEVIEKMWEIIHLGETSEIEEN